MWKDRPQATLVPCPVSNRFPSRYLVSLKVTVFSNMLPSFSKPPQIETHEPSSSTFRNKPIMPLMKSSQSHVNQTNQTNIPLTPINSLTPHSTATCSHTPRFVCTLPQATSSVASTSAKKLDFPIETTLNAHSVF